MKRITAFTLLIAMLTAFTTSCTRKEMKPMSFLDENANMHQIEEIAEEAYSNMIKNYWHEGEEYNYFVDPHKGDDTFSVIIWEYVQGLLGFETYYAASGDESVLYYVKEQFKTWTDYYGKEWLLSTGKNNNPCVDDAAWSAMGFLLWYKLSGDEEALDYCHDMIKNAYDFWQDGSTENGLWYRYEIDFSEGNPAGWEKSLYTIGLMLSSLEYHQITKGTEREDLELWERTLALYEWTEEHLRRDKVFDHNGGTVEVKDNLYFLGYYENKDTGESYPMGINNPNDINPAGSCSALFANTGIAVFNKRMFDITGDTKYLEKAVSTANALTGELYRRNGILINDRDAWTNCSFIGYFVREVLPLEGIDPKLGKMLFDTAISIRDNNYFDGYYGSDWAGGTRWYDNGDLGHPEWFANSATSTHLIYAAYYAAKNDLIDFNAE